MEHSIAHMMMMLSLDIVNGSAIIVPEFSAIFGIEGRVPVRALLSVEL